MADARASAKPAPKAAQAGRRRTATLTQEAIIDAALALTTREGTSALSMRRLGEQLGVDATAVYRHFRDKDDIVLAIGDRAAAWTLARFRERITADTSWQGVLRAFAASAWESAAEFPAVHTLTFARTTGRESEREIVELLLSTLVDAGLDRERAALTYRVFADTILGLTGAQATLETLDARSREKDISAWTRIYAVLPDETYPETRRHAAELIGLTDNQVYVQAVEMLIVAIEAPGQSASDTTP